MLVIEGPPLSAFSEALRQADGLGFAMQAVGENACRQRLNSESAPIDQGLLSEEPLEAQRPAGARLLWVECEAVGSDGSTTLRIRMRHRVPEEDLRWISHLVITQRPGVHLEDAGSEVTFNGGDLPTASSPDLPASTGEAVVVYSSPVIQLREGDRLEAPPSLTGEAPGCRGGLEAILTVEGDLEAAVDAYRDQLESSGYPDGPVHTMTGMGGAGFFTTGQIPAGGSRVSIAASGQTLALILC